MAQAAQRTQTRLHVRKCPLCVTMYSYPVRRTIEWGPGPRRTKGPAEERVSLEHSNLSMECLGDFNEWTPVAAG